MRLALVYHQMITRGGLEGYLREFAARLREAGHSLTLVTSRVDGAFRSLADEVRIIPPALTKSGTLRRFAAGSAAVVPELRRTGHTVLAFGRTWSQDVHRAGGGSHWHYSRMLPWWKRWRPKNRLELDLERRLYTGGQTRRFVVNSSKVRTELTEAWGVAPERITVIHTAVDAQYWTPLTDDGRQAALRRELGIPPEVPALIFASLDHRRKGLGTLLTALTRVPEARLWVAGQDTGPWRREIARLGLTERVRGVGRADLRPWFQAADWFVHPTFYDACANTVLQSMACGLPGIISSGDGAAEFVRPGRNGYLLRQPGNGEELADLLKQALALAPDRRAAMAAAARTAVESLTWQSHLDGWERLVAEFRGRK